MEQKKAPRCPVCGEQCYSIAINGYGDAAGCEHCLSFIDSATWRNRHQTWKMPQKVEANENDD